MQPTVAPSAVNNLAQFGFYLMGDTPYSSLEDLILRDQIQNMTLSRREGTIFAVHVGDFQVASRSGCNDAAYTNVFTRLQQGPLPTFVLAGDNDFYDCTNPEEAWQRYTRSFVGYEDQWANRLPPGVPRLGVTRWSQHQEMFAFEHNGILFLSVNLVNGKPTEAAALEKWNARMSANIEWVETNVHEHFATGRIRGVIIFGHALRSPDTRIFFTSIAALFVNDPRRKFTPVLYLHGDGHQWQVDTRLASQLDWDAYRDVQVEQGGKAEPCIVEIAPLVNGVTSPLTVEHDLQHVFGNGLFRIDRQGGSYPGSA